MILLITFWILSGLTAGIVPHSTMPPQRRRWLVITVGYLICAVFGPVSWLFMGMCWIVGNY